MQVINLTPHSVVIIQDGEVVREYAPSGKVAKLLETDQSVTPLDGIPAVRKQYGEVVILDRGEFLGKVSQPKTEPFPPEQGSIVYIVAMLIGQQLSGQRDDLYGPDFGIGGVRTTDGKIAGAVGFIKY